MAAVAQLRNDTGERVVDQSRFLACRARADGLAIDPETRLRVARTEAGYRVACPDVGSERAITIAVLADHREVEGLIGALLSSAEERVRELRGMLEDGTLPSHVATLGEALWVSSPEALGIDPSATWLDGLPLVGAGVSERDQARLGVVACVGNAMDRMLVEREVGLKPQAFRG